MRWGTSKRVPAIVGIVLAILLAVLLCLADDPCTTALALWRAARFPFGFALGGLALATLFDRGG